MKKPRMYCLDLESTLTPEIWISIAKASKVKELMLTTRDVPDYAALMRRRIETTREHSITIKKMQRAVKDIRPLPGARRFLDALRAANPVLILSDTYYEIAMPLVAQFKHPALFCHSLSIDSRGYVTDFHLRKGGSKREVVRAMKALGFEVYAIGDSHNDTAMLAEADKGFFIHAPETIEKKFPQFPAFHSYDKLLRAILR